MRWLAAVPLLLPLLALAQEPEVAPDGCRSPADAVLAAAADVTTLPPEVAYYTRYLDLGNLPVSERGWVVLTLAGHVNHLSRVDVLTAPQLVPGTQASLLRLNLQHYAWDIRIWERLASEDPYFHVQLAAENGSGKKVLLAPWLTPTAAHRRALEVLVAKTSSDVPVVNGAWLHNQTAAAVERSPNYYDFLGGVKVQEDFWKLTGFDARQARLFGGDVRAAVADSGVSSQPRAVARWKSYAGAFWYTLDFKLAAGQRDPLLVTGAGIEDHFDATEQYGTLPNGLWAMGLFDSKGKAQASAPDFVGKDSMSKSNDGRIHNPISCIRCHGGGGLRSIDDWHRSLIAPPLRGNVLDLKHQGQRVEIDFRRQYASNLEKLLAEDRRRYDERVQEATTWDSATWARNSARLWEWTEDGRIDLARAARDLGVSRDRLRVALARDIAAGTGHPGLSRLVREPPRPLPWRLWLSYIPAAQQLLVRYP